VDKTLEMKINISRLNQGYIRKDNEIQSMTRKKHMDNQGFAKSYTACSLVGFWAGLGWLMLIYCERKTLLVGWFELAETNKRTG